MFERFDKSLRLTLVRAPEDAASLGSRTIEAEHLLLGLASSPETPAGEILSTHGISRTSLLESLRDSNAGFDDEDAEALASVGIDLRAIQEAADRTFGEGSFAEAGLRPPRGNARFGEEAKSALAGSLHEALSLGAKKITTLHLLLALARDPRGRCSALLAHSGLDYDTIRRESGRAA